MTFIFGPSHPSVVLGQFLNPRKLQDLWRYSTGSKGLCWLFQIHFCSQFHPLRLLLLCSLFRLYNLGHKLLSGGGFEGLKVVLRGRRHLIFFFPLVWAQLFRHNNALRILLWMQKVNWLLVNELRRIELVCFTQLLRCQANLIHVAWKVLGKLSVVDLAELVVRIWVFLINLLVRHVLTAAGTGLDYLLTFRIDLGFLLAWLYQFLLALLLKRYGLHQCIKFIYLKEYSH